LVGLVAFAASSLLLSTETSRGLWLIVGLALALPSLARVPGAGRSAQGIPPARRTRYGGPRPTVNLIEDL
jgi:hypothetical protein